MMQISDDDGTEMKCAEQTMTRPNISSIPLLLSIVLTAALLSAACSRGPSRPQSGNESTADARQSSSKNDAAAGDGGAASDGATKVEAAPRTGIIGQIKALEGSPATSRVIATLPGTTEPVKTTTADAEGRFHLAGLEPETYRVILPADGVYSTAETYVTVPPDAGLAEVELPRSRGCEVTIAVRQHDNHLVAGATLDFALSDLPQVAQPHHVRAETNAEGRLVVVGSCVRGFLQGTVTVPNRGEYPFRHGYVGTGRDQFDIVLPESPDGGVTFTNDD
jgi:hypothetical protein